MLFETGSPKYLLTPAEAAGQKDDQTNQKYQPQTSSSIDRATPIKAAAAE
jgi:hypothetical protein